MPQVVIAAIAYYGGYITAFQLIVVAALSAYSYDQQRTARLRARRDYNNSLKDRVVNIATVDGARARVYGRVRCADGVLFKGTHGAKNEKLTMVIALAGHEIDAVEAVYFNDVQVAFDGNGYVTTAPWSGLQYSNVGFDMPPGTPTAGLPPGITHGSIAVVRPGDAAGRIPDQLVDFELEEGGSVIRPNGSSVVYRRVVYQTEATSPKARVRAFLGSNTQDISGVLAADFPGLITSAHKFTGIACLVVQLEYDQDAFPMGPPTISAVIRGAKVLDPRDGVTRWTENPALIARDFALYPFGGGAATGDLDEPSFVAAANACDVVATFNTINAYGSGNTQNLPTFTAGLLVRSDQAPDQVLGDIVTAMAGRWAWAGGKLRVRAGSYQAPVATITEDWISDKADIEVVATQARSELVNVITPTIANKAQAYVAAPIPRIAATEYIASDGGEYPLDLTLDAVTDVAHAAHVAGVMLRGGRQALTVTLPCNMRALVLELFDTVAVTLPRFGWNAKPFEVLGWAFTLEGGIKLTLRETDASIYTVGALFTRSDAAPNTALPSPYTVPALAIASLASGTAQLLRQVDGTLISRLKVSWAPIQDEAVLNGGAVELRYGPAISDPATWLSATVPGGDTQVLLTGVQDGAAYAVSIRARNRLVAGAWSPLAVHVIEGKSAPPADVYGLAIDRVAEGVLVTWQANTEADYAETQVRLMPAELIGLPYEWSELPVLWRGAASATVWRPPGTGTYYLMVRHADTSGHLSAMTASVVVNYDANAVVITPILDLSRPAMVLPAAADGTVTDYSQASCVIKVLQGATDVTSSWALARTSPAAVSSTLAAGVLSVVGLTADSSSVTVTATRLGYTTLTRQIALSRARAGAPGSPGSPGAPGDPGAPGSPGSPGAPGARTADVDVFAWALSTPAAPVGVGSYTWATGALTVAPSGWVITPGAGSPGFTLYRARVRLSNTSTAPIDAVDWSLSSVAVVGYAGANGAPGAGGAPGLSARLAYTVIASGATLGTGTRTSTGITTPPAANAWGLGETWSMSVPSYGTNQTVWQTNGIHDPATDVITWDTPYVSALKVGALSAISANLGSVTAGDITGVTITGGLIRTATSGKRMVLNEGSTNTFRMYGDVGGGEQLIAEIGKAAAGGFGLDTRLAEFWGPSGLGASICSGPAVSGVFGYSSGAGNGVRGSSSSGYGLYGASSSGAGVYATSAGGAGFAVLADGGISIALSSSHEPYGPLSITRNASGSHCYVAMVRSGQFVYGMGIDTSNRLWMGTATSGLSGGLSTAYLYLNSSGLQVVSGLGVHGQSPQARASVNAAATDLSSVVALTNQLRTALINVGICQ